MTMHSRDALHPAAAIPRAVFALVFLSLGAGQAPACSVPVFRYALERWPADPYEIIVFHRGPLPDEARKAVARLDDAAHGQGVPANLELVTVDLDADPEPALQQLWDKQANAELPWMIVRYPRVLQRDATVWAGHLTPAAAEALLHSPLRRQLAQLLLKGETGVWILLESGDRTADAAAAELLRKQLKRMPDVLKLPELNPNDPADRIAAGPGAPELKIAFTLLRLSRTDPVEQALVQMLLHAEDDLIAQDVKPIAFPVFGRGRVHFALVGGGIVAANVGKSCASLVGPCTCQIKQEYPGTDLLLSTDWEQSLKGPARETEPLASTTVKKSVDAPAVPAVTEADTDDTEADPGGEARLHWLLLALLGAVASTVATALVLGRGRRSQR